MKKLLLMFLSLVVTFTGTWFFKSKTPGTRPDSFAGSSYAQDAWWETANASIVADSEYQLSDDVKDNYIPVPGEKDLFMVVDNNGNITKYVRREKQNDGSYDFITTDPNIPANYVAVEGLDNVYKETTADGKVKYYKYIRNEDDTFAFIEVDSKGNVIDKDIQKNSDGSIPENYKRIEGTNVYAVYNKNNVIIAYKERKMDANGNYYWVDATKPTKTKTGSSNNSVGYLNGQKISNNGQKQSPNVNIGGGKNNTNNNKKGTSTGNKVYSSIKTKGNGNNAGNNHTETSTSYSYKIKDGYKYTYKTVTVRTYKNGELVNEKVGNKTLVKTEKITSNKTSTNNTGKAKATLNEELARISVGVSYNNSLSNKILGVINKERKSNGMTSLTMSSGSSAYKMAKCKAAEMAKTGSVTYNSSLYGSISEMCVKYKVSGYATEAVYKCSTAKSYTAIGNALVSLQGSVISSQFSNVGIAVVSANGSYYISLVVM